MPLSGQSSLDSEESLFAGEWSRAYAVVDPLTDPTEVYLGIVKEGVLRVSREEIQYFGTDFPPSLEVVIPSQVNMQFAGRADELRARLAHFLVGDERIDNTSQYVYPGAGCAFSDIDVQFNAERINCNSNMIHVRFWKARASGAIEVGAANDIIGTPIEINALNDSDGTMGGSANVPLGWIWFSQTEPGV